MVLTSIALVLLTAVAASLPAIWLARGQAQHQAWARVQQGLRATEALYAADARELTALATLTAQRPTLQDLVASGAPRDTWSYLENLRRGAGLDLVAVCDDAGTLVVGALADDPSRQPRLGSGTDPCVVARSPGYLVTSSPTVAGDTSGGDPSDRSDRSDRDARTVWLLSDRAPIGIRDAPEGANAASRSVMVARRLDASFAAAMARQTGMEHSLLVGEHVGATSIANGSRSVEAQWHDETLGHRGRLAVGDQPLYFARTALTTIVPEVGDTATPVDVEVALPVGDLAGADQRLLRGLTAAILLVGAAGSLLAVLLARRISRPLAELAASAESFRGGHLDAVVPDAGDVREVSLVAQALEDARRNVRRSIDELREEKAWSDQLLDAIVEGIVTLDHSTRISYFSSGAERITGWRRDEAMGQPCDEVFRPAETDAPFSDLMPEPGRRLTVTVSLANGRRATLAVTGAHLVRPERGDDRVALVFRDVTDSESMHRVMGHFLANVSHEFLTPLTALAASAELLRDQAPDLSREEMQELLMALHVGILKLHTLVDNLLEGASIEAGRFHVSTRAVALDEIVAEAVKTMRPLLDRHGQRIDIDLPTQTVRACADPRRTTQVLVNLLSNASRYGPDDSTIELRARVIGDHVRVHVSDRGPGIPPTLRDSVFHRFVYRDVDGDRASVGAGLGLSVVKTIVEAQDGSVGVSARDGGGSRFWFTIPLARGT